MKIVWNPRIKASWFSKHHTFQLGTLLLFPGKVGGNFVWSAVITSIIHVSESVKAPYIQWGSNAMANNIWIWQDNTCTCHKPWCTLHTTFYGSAAGCRSIQKTCAFWKHGLTSRNTHSHLTYFCKSNINQTFTNGGGMIWGVRIAIFTEIRHLVEELITFLSFFGPQKLGILTARLNKSLSISTSYSVRGD